MNAYIFQADLICEDCAKELEDFDSDNLWSSGGGEADSPNHCAICCIPLDNALTQEGVNYVLDTIRDSFGKDFSVIHAHPEDKTCWYTGSRNIEIVRDWAEQVKSYLDYDSPDYMMVDYFLEVSEE